MEYFKKLMEFLTIDNAIKRNKILIILDNSSSHRAGSVKNFIEK